MVHLSIKKTRSVPEGVRNLSKTAIVGIGNYIMQDEGVGVHVLNRLSEMQCIPYDVELIDAGVNSYDMVDIFGKYEHLIVIDAMQAGGEPGTIYRAPLDDLGLRPVDSITSLHEMHFIEAVQMVRLLGYDPQIMVFGIEPESMAAGMELSPAVKVKIPQIIELITQELKQLYNCDEQTS